MSEQPLAVFIMLVSDVTCSCEFIRSHDNHGSWPQLTAHIRAPSA